MNLDRKQMMDERKSLMQEFRQVRQAMRVGKKGKSEKNETDPMDVIHELLRRIHGVVHVRADVHMRKK